MKTRKNKENREIAKLKKKVLRLLSRGGNLCDWTKVRIDDSENVLNSFHTQNLEDLESLKVSFDLLGRVLFNKDNG